MGVRGLKSFIDKNDGLSLKNYHLYDTPIVIDANNLVSDLFFACQKHERRDLFGGDLVQYGQHLHLFFNNLKRCNIVPIVVFDGARIDEENRSKTPEKHRRALRRFRSVISISRCGFGDFILPATASIILRSISVDRGIQVVQCMYEADLEVARISNENKCPVLSNDSDFLLMGLNYGVIPIDRMNYTFVKKFVIKSSSNGVRSDVVTYNYLECNLFKQEYFLNYLPNLNLMTLPLLAVLSGNDFIESRVFYNICQRLSATRAGPTRKLRVSSERHEKISKILHFLCGKSLNEAVNQICLNVPKEQRQELKKLIRSNLSAYDIPVDDVFKSELERLYWPGYRLTFSRSLNNDQALIRREFEICIDSLRQWIKRAMEESVLSRRFLELVNKNIVFIMGNLDDPKLPSAHSCQIRPLRVILTLLRSEHNDNKGCTYYDRVGYDYIQQAIRPLLHLDEFGPLDYLFYDLLEMDRETRRAIVLATFHCPLGFFEQAFKEYYGWFDLICAEEFLLIKILMDYLDIENNQQVRLWNHFRQATLLCKLYHIFKDKSDRRFGARLEYEDVEAEYFMINLASLIKGRRYSKMPVIGGQRKYNCRIVHQITQLHSAITIFNNMNAFLGDPLTRIRSERWLNSCIIYNLAEALHHRTLKLAKMPNIVYNIARFEQKTL